MYINPYYKDKFVVCVLKPKIIDPTLKYPERNRVYTIRHIQYLGSSLQKTVRLNELKNPLIKYRDGYTEVSFKFTILI